MPLAPEGLAGGPAVSSGLEKVGLRRSAFIWRWHYGAKGGIFPAHLDLQGHRGQSEDDFDGHRPRADLNGKYCMCLLQAEWRDERGQFASPPPDKKQSDTLQKRIKTARAKLK